MKILHITTGLGIGGAEMMLFKLLSNIDRSEYESEVVSLTSNDVIGNRISSLGVKVHTLNMKGGVPTPSGLIALVKLIRQFKPDVIQTWMYHADLFGGCLGKLASKSKIVWNIRQGDLEYRNLKLHTYITAKLSAWISSFVPDVILTNSFIAKDNHVEGGYQLKKFKVIPNGFDTDVFKPKSISNEGLYDELGLDKTLRIVGTVGRFHHQKDFNNFIKAAKLISKEFIDVRFCMCGSNIDKDNKELMSWINEADLNDFIFLLGPRSDISNILSDFDIFVSSSSCGEAFGNVIGEAMSCAIPCVVTDVGDSAIIVGNTGKVVQRENSILLANATKELLNLSETDLVSKGERARQRIIENYSIKHIASLYTDFYQQLIK